MIQVPSLPASEIPVVADVDVLIVGGTSQAVAFALKLKSEGQSVFLLAPRSYLGEDICGAYRFWPEGPREDPLAKEVFGEGPTPPTPMHVKLTLEQSLVNKKIPFLLNSYSAGVLWSESGRVAGAVIANRSGHQAVRANVVVDATMEAMLLRQAGCDAVWKPQGKDRIDFVTLCEGEGEAAASERLLEELPGYADSDFQISARRYEVEVDYGDGSPEACGRALSEVVERCWVQSEYRHQTLLTPRHSEPETFPVLRDLWVEEGLLSLSESGQVSQGKESVFANPLTGMAVAADLAKELSQLRVEPVGDERILASCAGSKPLERGVVSTLRDALRPGASAKDTVAWNPEELPVLGKFDVVVAGGGTGGAPAAIAAGRAGASTLVIEATSGLGGVGTMGQISRYWCGNRVGFTSEIDRGVKNLEWKEELQQDPEGWSVAAKCSWYHRNGVEVGCIYWFNTACVGTIVDGDRVVGLIVAGPYGYGVVSVGCVVDSTGCSDIPAAAGAPTAVIGKEHVAVQGTGLAGVRPGRDYRNSDHSFSDDTDVVDATSFFVSSKLKFRGDFDCGELVDSRERRQIIGDFRMTPVDVLFGRRFPDTVCVATSNFDSHGFTVDPVFMIIPPDKKEALWADIPLGCMLPKGLDGVLVTGLGMSAHRDTLPVIRMQADVQNQGYAAGQIAARSAMEGVPVREVDLKNVQKHLIDIGNLPERVLTDEDNFPVSDAILEKAVNEDWDNLAGVSLMLHEGERSLPFVRDAYRSVQTNDSSRSLRYAQILAMLGDDSGERELTEEISKRDWDAGWQFQGMHQFGMNMSELDSLLVCLGSVGGEDAWDCLLEKIETLPEDAEFSHIRALAMACESLYPRHPNSKASSALAEVLERPNYRGYAHKDQQSAQDALSEDINENQVRNLALRELHLARALYRCGDLGGLGKEILEEYRGDFRGHFARHASAVLASDRVLS